MSENLDGRIRTSDETSENLDGRIRTSDEMSENLDGRIRTSDEMSENLDGRIRKVGKKVPCRFQVFSSVSVPCFYRIPLLLPGLC
jgi:hypothetical protein